jgi:DNA-binding CsgD family transcriptional regulator
MYARLTRAEIHVARGEFGAAEQLLAEIGRVENSDPRFVGPLYGCIADAAAWQRHLEKADEVVAAGMRAIGTSTPRVVVQLCAIGLRVAADREDIARADELLHAIPGVEKGSASGEIAWLTRQCRAEHARASHTDTAQMWAEIANGWARLHQPFRETYARRYQAGAQLRAGDRPEAMTDVRRAYGRAEEIGAKPLQSAIKEFANATRLRLGSGLPYDLTEAEYGVLAKLAAGARNKDIAASLSISVETVAIHVRNIRRKMGARNRQEAALKALHEGIIGG